MISRLEASRYRCFEHLGIDMSEFQVVVGANGAGKTTLMDLPVVLGELLRADNIASVFTLKRGEQPARTTSLRDLVFAGRGNDFSLALEARLPEIVRNEWVQALLGRTRSKKQADALRNSPERWPSRIRYELRLEIFNEREINVKNEYLFVFPEASVPDRAVGGLLGELNREKADWHFILTREYGGPAVLTAEIKPESMPSNSASVEMTRVKPNLLALPAVKYKSEGFAAANWLYDFLTDEVVFLSPDWERLRAASPPGQKKSIITSALNLPWLALELKNLEKPDDAPATYRSERYEDWVAHVQTALPQVLDIDVREREDDHHSYFVVSYRGGFSVPSSGLSDGTLRILTLTLLPYLNRSPAILMTEEPENGIHPRAVEAVLQSLSSMYDSQVWVTSHSPVVLAQAELRQLVCARVGSEGSVNMLPGTEHPRLKEWRGGIDLGSLFAAGVLG